MPATLHPFGGDRPQEPAAADELDARIQHVLKHLPREEAGAAFTVHVLERTGVHRSRRYRLRSLAAAAAFCAFGALGVYQWNENQSRQVAAERLASLQLEYQVLQQELLELERAAEKRRPVVYLGGQGDVEYVIDLSRLAPRHNARPNPGSDYRAASYGPGH